MSLKAQMDMIDCVGSVTAVALGDGAACCDRARRASGKQGCRVRERTHGERERGHAPVNDDNKAIVAARAAATTPNVASTAFIILNHQRKRLWQRFTLAHSPLR